MINWKCDICHKHTFINPPTQPVLDDDGKPKMSFTRVQDDTTGAVKKVSVPEIKDTLPRAYIVRLSIGNEVIKRDFCKECLQNHAGEELKALWDKLETLK